MKCLFVILLLPISMIAQAEVYKCPALNGSPVYQEKPCPGGNVLELDDTNPAGPVKGRSPRTARAVGLRPEEKQMLNEIRQQERLDRAMAHRHEVEQLRIDQRNKELCATARQNKRWAESKQRNSRHGSKYEADVERYSAAVKSYCH